MIGYIKGLLGIQALEIRIKKIEVTQEVFRKKLNVSKERLDNLMKDQ